MPTELDELNQTHTWLKSQTSLPLAVALVDRLDKIKATSLDLQRLQLLNGFVNIVADDIKEMLGPSERRYSQAEVDQMVKLFESAHLVTANAALPSKRKHDLNDQIYAATWNIHVANRRESRADLAGDVARWASSAAEQVSTNESFAAWHLILLRYAHFLMFMIARLSGSTDIPFNTEMNNRLKSFLELMRVLHTETDAQIATPPEHEADLAYENQMLGAFIYQLGYNSCESRTVVPVNMFQQTPHDGSFGDLVAGSSHCFAIEFKRDIKSLESERKKWTEEGLAALSKEVKIISASEKCHLLCYGETTGKSLSFAAKLYATSIGVSDLEVKLSGAEINSRILGIVSGEQPDAALPTGLPPDQLENYLRTLAQLRNSSKGGDRASWLALYIGKNEIHFQMASSLSSLVELISTPDPGTSPEMKVGKRTL